MVIPAYQRHELLQDRIKEIVSWPGLDRLVISVDGLRPRANFEEEKRRLALIDLSLFEASNCSKIEVIIHGDNQGVNVHTQRIFQKALSLSNSVIVIEEDVGVSEATLDFLRESLEVSGFTASAGHSLYSHPSRLGATARSTLFPIQWAYAVNREVMEKYLEVIHTKAIEFRLLHKVFKSHLKEVLSDFEILKLALGWFNHFFFCLQNPNYADALIQYSVLACQGSYRVPLTSLVIDCSPINDLRSMTIRKKHLTEAECSSQELELNSDYSILCSTCERRDSRLHEMNYRTLLGGAKHHLYLRILAKQKN